MRWIAAVLLVVACSPLGATDHFCDRFLDLYDDMESGRIDSFEAEERLLPESLGSPEGSIGDTYRELLRRIGDGDEAGAVESTYRLVDSCLDLVSNR